MARSGDDRLVIGLHPIRELLRADRALRRILVDAERSRSDTLDEVLRLAASRGVPVEHVPRGRIERDAEGYTHQGVLAIAPAFPYVDLDHILSRVERSSDPALLVLLDGVTDPHNLGAIARTAETAGAHGLLIPRHRAAHVTPVVEKAAAGALAHLPVARVANVASTLRALGQRRVWSVGLDGTAPQTVFSCALLTEPVVLVIGSEGRGLARSTHVCCDTLVSLPLQGQLESLNASAAAAVALYEVRRQRTTEESSSV